MAQSYGYCRHLFPPVSGLRTTSTFSIGQKNRFCSHNIDL